MTASVIASKDDALSGDSHTNERRHRPPPN
jgi:hypothetical protein